MGSKIGKACFSTDTALIIDITLWSKHRMMCVKNTLITGHVGRLDGIIRVADHASESFILQSLPEDQRHIFSRRIMVFIRKSAGIGKMCIRASDLGCTLVHHINKILLSSAYVLCNLGSCIIGGLDDQGMQTILHSHDLAYF